MNPVKFSLQGPADIIGLGNGDPRCHEPQKKHEPKAAQCNGCHNFRAGGGTSPSSGPSGSPVGAPASTPEAPPGLAPSAPSAPSSL